MQIKEKTMKRGRTNKDEKVALYKLFSFADTWDKVFMLTGFLAAIANGLAMPIMTMIFGEVINAFGVADRDSIVHEVSKVVIKYVYLALGAGLAAFLQVSCWMVTGERQAARIRGLYLKTILRQDISFFDTQTSTGEVTARMTGNTILIQDAIGEKVGKFIQLLSTFLGGIVVAFTRGWFLSLVLLACIPPTVLAGAAMSLILSRLAIKSQLAYAEAGNVVEQTVGSIRTVVSFTGEKNAIEKYNGFLKLAYEMAVHQGAIIGLGFGSLMFFIFSSYALAIWYGSKLIIEKGYNGGTIINIIVALMTGSMSLGQTSPCINAFASGQAAAYKMFNVIYRKPLIDSYDTKGIVLPIIRGDIELKNIRFSYPARPDQIIFENFSLQVPHGTTMALVGESGSGKSTVISLVERFYDPDHGKVMIDGVNLKEMRLSWIRENIGLVSQEPVLFATSIRENIEFGNKNATKIELRRAIELANAAKFIDKLPNGLDTMVGEHGTQLSGGQKQRIAIARAILKNPKILLLDEATSALDAESEKVVQDALSKLMQGRTTIVVAHRLSTIKNADMISVVHRGKLIEQGSHAELTRNPEGAYSQLIQLQDHANSETKEELISARSSMDRSATRSESSHGSIRMAAEDHTVQDYQSNDCKKQRKEVSLTRLAYLNKSETHVLLLGSAVAAISGVIMPIFGALLSITIKMFYRPVHELRNDARFWSLIYVALGVVYLVALPVQYYLFGVAGAKLVERIRSSCFERVVHQEISWFDDPSNSSGAIGARLSIDAAYVRGLVGDSLSLMVQNFATLLAGLIIAMFANWKLAFIVLCILPCIGAEAYVHIKFLKGFSADAKKKYEEASTVANDAVRSIRTVASFCAEHEVMDTYEKKCYSTVKHGLRQGVLSGIGYGFSYMLLYSSYALCFYVGASFVHAGSATFGQVFRVFFALTMAATRISQSSASAPDVNKAKDSASSIFEILDRKSKIDSSSYNGTELATVNGAIEFQHVGFRYPIRPDIEIFKDLCLKIPPGKTIAIVGESGSGKSTIIALLERFYDPDSGSILLDGVDLQSLKINWLRQQIGLVGQEPVVFNGTIASNIAYSKPGNVSQEEIVAASKAANAHGFISALRDGYNTSVGEHGIQLSGGQKQRVAIARAILKKPRILLLDEATSALDAELERTVQEALDQVMVGRTSIIVAHRLSTILNASKIAVVKDGAIAEQGRHEDLIRVVGGTYASLVALHSNCS